MIIPSSVLKCILGRLFFSFSLALLFSKLGAFFLWSPVFPIQGDSPPDLPHGICVQNKFKKYLFLPFISTVSPGSIFIILCNWDLGNSVALNTYIQQILYHGHKIINQGHFCADTQKKLVGLQLWRMGLILTLLGFHYCVNPAVMDLWTLTWRKIGTLYLWLSEAFLWLI